MVLITSDHVVVQDRIHDKAKGIGDVNCTSSDTERTNAGVVVKSTSCDPKVIAINVQCPVVQVSRSHDGDGCRARGQVLIK